MGSCIELHYVDAKGAKRAAFAFPEFTPVKFSKRPGHSLHRVVTVVTNRSRTIDASRKQRSMAIGRRAVVIRIVRAAVIAAVAPGDEVLVKYADQSSDIVTGHAAIPGTDLKMLEVPRLGPGSQTARGRQADLLTCRSPGPKPKLAT